MPDPTISNVPGNSGLGEPNNGAPSDANASAPPNTGQSPGPTRLPDGSLPPGPMAAKIQNLARLTAEQVGAPENAALLAMLNMPSIREPEFRPEAMNDPQVKAFKDLLDIVPIIDLPNTGQQYVTPAEQIAMDFRDILSQRFLIAEQYLHLANIVAGIKKSVGELDNHAVGIFREKPADFTQGINAIQSHVSTIEGAVNSLDSSSKEVHQILTDMEAKFMEMFNDLEGAAGA